MLETLTVWNFALVEHAQIDFNKGLNILTGETGAGKSIMIDAIGAVLGNRLSADIIRTGCDWARVEAVFSIEEQTPIHAYLQEQAIADEENTLIITRQITHNGRSAILVNGSHITLGALKQLGAMLMDVHGQNENLALLKSDNQFSLLDGYDEAIYPQLSAYRESYDRLNVLRDKLSKLEKASEDRSQRLEMLEWQVEEIEKAELKENEDEELEKEIKRLTNSEKLAGYVASANELLYGGERDSQGIISLLEEAVDSLQSIERFDDSLVKTAEIIKDAAIQIKEAAYEVRDYGDSLEYDPRYLDSLQSRMDVIDKLCRKYGATVADVMEYHKKAKAELSAIADSDETIQQLKGEIKEAAAEASSEAKRLTELREKAARGLSGSIEGHLLALGMPEARLEVSIKPLELMGPDGADDIEIMFSANPGEVMRAIQKVASGGELSRIALAIKTVTAFRDDSPASMIFDEIDTGIGGRTAQMVAERIAMVSLGKQVLCITHLPQIAAMADTHLYISKNVIDGKTVTTIRPLTDAERVNEISRMASGADVSAASLENAREMLHHAAVKKAQLMKH